jgi:predicted nucleotidyltransferase
MAIPATQETSLSQRLQGAREEVIAVAHRHGACNLRIYGSIAKGQEHNGSDLDLLVDLAADQTLLGLIRLRQELEDLLGCPVDVTEAETLHPLIRSEVLNQALPL